MDAKTDIQKLYQQRANSYDLSSNLWKRGPSECGANSWTRSFSCRGSCHFREWEQSASARRQGVWLAVPGPVAFNRLLWRMLKGADTPYPQYMTEESPPRTSPFPQGWK